jgi:hypothetical protein
MQGNYVPLVNKYLLTFEMHDLKSRNNVHVSSYASYNSIQFCIIYVLCQQL